MQEASQIRTKAIILLKKACTKRVQNCDIIFFFQNSKMTGLRASSPQIWIAITIEGEGVQNSSSVVQNCTECVQNYGTIFILKFENGGAGGMDLLGDSSAEYRFWSSERPCDDIPFLLQREEKTYTYPTTGEISSLKFIRAFIPVFFRLFAGINPFIFWKKSLRKTSGYR